MDIARQVNEIASEQTEDSKEQIEKIEKENKALVDARKAQMDNVAELMKASIDIELNIISEDLLPEAITAKQINSIERVIE